MCVLATWAEAWGDLAEREEDGHFLKKKTWVFLLVWVVFLLGLLVWWFLLGLLGCVIGVCLRPEASASA